jgi:outer membrane protein TolC
MATPNPMGMMIMWTTFLLASALAAGPSPEPLTIEATLRLAAEREPTAFAAEHEADAAVADADFATRLPAPEWMAGIENLPITGDHAGSFGMDEMTMRMVGVEQMWPSKRMRMAGRDAALAMGDVARAEAEAARRMRAREAGRMWVEGWRAAATTRLLNAEMAALDDALSAATTMMKSEAGGGDEVLLLEVERAELEAMAAAMDGERIGVEAWLGAELGQTVAIAETDPKWTTPDADAVERALDRHPELRMAAAMRLQADAEAGMAQAQGGPEWRMAARYGARSAGRDDMLGLEVGVRFDAFARDRQSARERAAYARADAAEARLAAKRRELLQLGRSARAKALAAAAGQRRIEKALLSAAADHAALVRSRYAAGQATLADALSAERLHFSHQREAIRLRGEALLALVDLYSLLPEWPQ